MGLFGRSRRGEDDGAEVLSRGRWYFEGEVMTIELVVFDPGEVERAYADAGHLDAHPVPAGHDGPIYFLKQHGDLVGPCFLCPEDARAWADEQPWAPIEWGEET